MSQNRYKFTKNLSQKFSFIRFRVLYENFLPRKLGAIRYSYKMNNHHITYFTGANINNCLSSAEVKFGKLSCHIVFKLSGKINILM